MNLNTITNSVKTVGKYLKTYSPNILMALGTAGTVTTVIFAVRATPKALRVIQEETADTVTESRSDWVIQTALDSGFKKTDILKMVWRYYLPAAGMGVMSLACFWGAQHINASRQVALAGAYSIAETALSEYQNKIVDILGEEAGQQVRDAISQDHADSVTEEVITDDGGKHLCMDSFSGRYFKSDKETIIHHANQFNKRLLDDCELTMNDWYEELGLEALYPIGDFVGWSRNTELLDISFGAAIAANGEPCIYVEYRAPIVSYNF